MRITCVRRPTHVARFCRDRCWVKSWQLLESFIYILHAHPAETLADLNKNFPRIEIIKEIGLPAINLLTQLVHPQATIV
jgi:hypothetical protein